VGQAHMHPGEKGSCTQKCEVCHQHFILMYLWDYVSPGEGKWVCMACLAPALYADAVRIIERERDQHRACNDPETAWVRPVGQPAFGSLADPTALDKVLYKLAQKLQRRASRVLGMDSPPPRYMG